MAEVEKLPRQLTNVVRSDQFLRYFEVSTIIAYSDSYVQLLDNIICHFDVLAVDLHLPVWGFEDSYNRRRSFFPECGCVLQETAALRRNWQAHMQLKKPCSVVPTILL